MTNEGLKRCFSETILKASRGMYAMSCVNSEAVLDDKDYDPPRKQSEIVTKQEQCHLAMECRQEDQEKELLGSFQPQRIRRSSSACSQVLVDTKFRPKVAVLAQPSQDPNTFYQNREETGAIPLRELKTKSLWKSPGVHMKLLL